MPKPHPVLFAYQSSDEPFRSRNLEKGLLTHVIYAFAIPNSDGSIEVDLAKLRAIRSETLQQGLKLVLSCGGWARGDVPLQSTFESLASHPASCERFVANCIRLCQDEKLDGLDLDWEFPNPETSDSFCDVVLALRSKMDASGNTSTLSIAVPGIPQFPEAYPSAALEAADFINIMAYDFVGDTDHHSSFESTRQALEWWSLRAPKQKLILGVPFYGRDSCLERLGSRYVPFRKLKLTTPSAEEHDEAQHEGRTIFYDGWQALQRKGQLARSQGVAGLMIWELSQDDDESTLLRKGLQGSGDCTA